jgi:Txe/YoeB family toxin of Txe-Axe toxin-antitoxin module
MQLCEHLPRLAQQTDKLALVRSFGHSNSSHGPADHYMLTGYHPTAAFTPDLKPNNQRPSHGAVIARQLGPRGSVPPYVCLPKMHNSAGSAYLGSVASPLVVESDPNSPAFQVPDLAPPLNIPANRLTARRQLLDYVNRFAGAAESRANKSASATDAFQEKAFELMTSTATRDAFDIHQEPEKLRDEYGRHSLGQSCLMSRRLVEAGVRCVLIDHTNWDTHYNNFHVLKNDLLPHLDSALSTLLRDLEDRGMLQSTLVLVTGEFGRTPRINNDAGRDHWGPSSAIALAGAGIRGGNIVGASDARAEKPATTPYVPADLASTIYHCLGIDPATQFATAEGRPVPIVPDEGRVIRELFG